MSTEAFSTPAQARAAARRGRRFDMEQPVLPTAATVAARKLKSGAAPLLQSEGWQLKAYDYVEQIGELGYIVDLMAATAAKGRLVVEETDEFGDTVEPVKDDEGRVVVDGDRAKAQRVLAALRGPTGSQASFISAFVRHDQIAGEAVLIGEDAAKSTAALKNPSSGSTTDTEPENTPTGISWELLSVAEVVTDAGPGKKGRVIRRRSGRGKSGQLSVVDSTATETPLDEDTYTSRYHRRSSKHSGDATSTVKRNATVCAEIVLLDQLKRTIINSRLSAHVVLVPEEVDFPAADGEDDDLSDAQRFANLLSSHMSAPMADPSSQAAIVPLVADVPAELIEKFRLFSLTDENGQFDLESIEQARQDALNRLAQGFDLPAERMSGLGSTSHWNAASIDVDEVRKHIVPVCDRFAEYLTEAYLRRMLVVFEGMSETDAQRFKVSYDGSEILTRMDAAASADALYRDGLMSGDSRIAAHGFDPDHVRPSDVERTQRILERVAAVPSVTNRAALAALLDLDEFPPEVQSVLEEWLAASPGMDDDNAAPDVAEDGSVTVGNEPPIEDAAEPGGPTQPGSSPTEMAVLVERIRTAGSGAAVRSLEKAANRVMTASKKLPADRRETIGTFPRSGPRKLEVLPALTTEDWSSLGLSPSDLVNGSFQEMEALTVVWVTDHLTDGGAALSDADRLARLAAAGIRRDLESLTQNACVRPLSRASDGIVVAPELVENVLAAAGVK